MGSQHVGGIGLAQPTGRKTQTDQTLSRIDDVLGNNKSLERIYIGLLFVLFACGITSFLIAIFSGQFYWTAPPVVTTGLMWGPTKAILTLRQKNIALATAPALISMLPRPEATEEIQKLLQTLYKEN